jgi:hypothetical protein
VRFAGDHRFQIPEYSQQISQRIEDMVRITRRLLSGAAALITAAVLFPGNPDAQVAGPIVTSLSGTLADGGTIQISGAAFGTKPAAAPLKFDDFERGANDVDVDGWDTYPNGHKPTFSTAKPRGNSRVSARANFVSTGPDDVSWNSAIGIANTPMPKIYLDGWYYLDAPAPYSRNHKPFRITSQDNNEPHLDYVVFCNNSLLTSTAGAITDQVWPELGPASFAGKWVHIQGYFEESSPATRDGFMRFWVDGQEIANQPVPTRNLAEERWENVWIGQYLGHDGDTNCPNPIGDAYAYWDDVYVDTSQARIEIGDAPTYEASRHREIQLPKKWTDSSITITVNQGSFTDLSNLWVYVIDGAGRVSDGRPLIVTADAVAPSVVSLSPSGSAGLPVTAVTATFDEPMTANRLTSANFELRDGSSVVNASVSYNAATQTATLTPSTALLPDRTYTARVRGGIAGVTDAAGNALAADVSWSFTTFDPARRPGLVAAYSFDEASGEAVVDSSGKKNAGAMQGGASRVAGQEGHGGAIQFDGHNGMVTVADADSLDLTTGLTLEAWVNPDELFLWNTIVMKEREREGEELVGGLAYALYANDDRNAPRGNINIGRLDEFASGRSQLPLNTWTHLATTYDGALLQVYVDGFAVVRRPVTGTLISTRGVLSIGGNPVWDEFFRGRIDDVRVYNRALSASEIKADSQIPVPPTEPAPEPEPPTETTVFGPKTYTVNGLPIIDRKTFEVADATGEYLLRMTNSGVKAAVVAVNGRIVLRPRDFVVSGGRGNDSDSFDEEWERIRKGKSEGSGTVPFIEVPVALRRGGNTLFVALWGPRGTSLTAEIVRTMLPPACTVTSPINGSAVIEGTPLVVSATATDNVRVTEVRFRSSDGSLDVTDRGSPFGASFTVPVGVSNVTFTATASDAAANATECSSTVSVLPTPPPTVTIVSPAPGTELVAGATGPVYVAATGDAIQRIDLSVNGVIIASDASGSDGFLFTVPAGVDWVDLRASAVDGRGKTGTSDQMIVPVVADQLTTITGSLVDKWGRPVAGGEVAVDVRGLLAEVFDFDTTLTEMPSLAGRTPSRTNVVSAANLRNPGRVFGADPFGFGTTSHAVRLSGYFRATRSGIYAFELGANEGGRLLVGGRTVVRLPDGSAGFQQGRGMTYLRQGLVPIQILTFDNGNPEIQLSYMRPGSSLRIVPQDALMPARSPFEAIADEHGLFTIPGVPTVLGDVGAWAIFDPTYGRTIEGEADPVAVVPGETTDLGVIRLR